MKAWSFRFTHREGGRGDSREADRREDRQGAEEEREKSKNGGIKRK